MKLDSISIDERRELNKLLSDSTLEDALNKSKSELKTERIKLLSTIPVSLVGATCMYTAISLDISMGYILKVGLAVPI